MQQPQTRNDGMKKNEVGLFVKGLQLKIMFQLKHEDREILLLQKI